MTWWTISFNEPS